MSVYGIFSSMETGSLADWFGALATLAAVIVAIMIATTESRATRKRETHSQAEQISVWMVYFGITNKPYVVIQNSSSLPVYDAVIYYGTAYGAGAAQLKTNKGPISFLKIPPGQYYSKPPKSPGNNMHARAGIAISFRDSNGHFWKRDATGMLHQINAHPFKELGISEPIPSWGELLPLSPLKEP